MTQKVLRLTVWGILAGFFLNYNNVLAEDLDIRHELSCELRGSAWDADAEAYKPLPKSTSLYLVFWAPEPNLEPESEVTKLNTMDHWSFGGEEASWKKREYGPNWLGCPEPFTVVGPREIQESKKGSVRKGRAIEVFLVGDDVYGIRHILVQMGAKHLPDGDALRIKDGRFQGNMDAFKNEFLKHTAFMKTVEELDFVGPTSTWFTTWLGNMDEGGVWLDSVERDLWLIWGWQLDEEIPDFIIRVGPCQGRYSLKDPDLSEAGKILETP